jgi:hypothetical protein
MTVEPRKSESEIAAEAVPQPPKRPMPRPRRKSAEQAYEHRDEWANSPGLQPPK